MRTQKGESLDLPGKWGEYQGRLAGEGWIQSKLGGGTGGHYRPWKHTDKATEARIARCIWGPASGTPHVNGCSGWPVCKGKAFNNAPMSLDSYCR